MFSEKVYEMVKVFRKYFFLCERFLHKVKQIFDRLNEEYKQVDLECNFRDRVYQIAKKIPYGFVSTYTEIAKLMGNSKAYRAVGSALNKNPYKDVPCHRVITSNGFVGGFNKGTNEKIKLLEKEGIKIKNKRVVNFQKVLFEPF